LGAGNHFLEVQVVEEIYDPAAASVMGIEGVGQVLLLIHTGSRGFGHQVCTDHLATMGTAVGKYGISLPDRQLACAPVKSPEGQAYFAAMACAANYAWANRQCITHWARESFIQVFGKSSSELGLDMIYDVAHNIAKMEDYEVEGKRLALCIHRKGATRAFPAGHPAVPSAYAEIGQPVLIPGDMGRYSYVLVGTEEAMAETFGSTCHGAGRVQSRSAAKRGLRGVDVARGLTEKGITVKAGSMAGLAEEASEAYKDVAQVVEVTHRAGISRKVAKARPLGVVKG
jgi:tRNA-splicing ligase RtcB